MLQITEVFLKCLSYYFNLNSFKLFSINLSYQCIDNSSDYIYRWASLVAQIVKNLPAIQETWVRFLGQEDPLEKGMAPTPVFLPGEFHGQSSLVGYSPWDLKESDMTE